MKLLLLLFGIIVAVLVALAVASLAYAGTFYAFDNTTRVFAALDGDLFIALKLAYADGRAGEWLHPGIAAGAGLTAAAGVLLASITGKRKSTDARFMTTIEATAHGLTKPGGVFVGRIGGGLVKVPGSFTQRGSSKRRWFRPQLMGGKKLWVDGDDVGGFVIGPPRSGKGAALIVPNCLLWPDSLIVLDMRGETYEATAGHRSKFSRVLRFSPADERGKTECYNPLDFVAVDPDQRDIDINSIATALLPTPKGESYWIADARALFAGVTSWVLENPEIPDRDKNIGTVLNVVEGGDIPLRTWLTSVATPDLRADWISSFTYTTLARFAVMADRQFDGVYGTLAAVVRPFKNQRILRATSRSTFDLRSMRSHNMSLYLDFRIQQVASIGPIFNVLMVQFMDHMSRTMMRRGEKRILVLLDEFQNLGKLENALTVATVLGGYGIPCWFFVQSLRSIDNVYTREGRQTLVNSARVQIFMGAQDPEDQRYVSQLLGDRREVTVDRAVSSGVTLFDRKSATTSYKTTMRPLMRPDELGSMDESRCVIKLRNQQPIFGIRNLYYADRELTQLAWLPIASSSVRENSKPASEQPLEESMTAAPTVLKDHRQDDRSTPGIRFRAKISTQSPSNPASKAGQIPDFRAAKRRARTLNDKTTQSVERVLAAIHQNEKASAALKDVVSDIEHALSDE